MQLPLKAFLSFLCWLCSKERPFLAGQVKALEIMAQTGQCCGQLELCLCLVEAAAWGTGTAGALMDMIKCDIVEQDSQGQCPDTG